MTKSTIKPWEVIKKNYLFENKYMTLRQEIVRLPTGQIHEDYFIREWVGFVTIFAMTEDGRVLMNREYKHGVKDLITTLPAGMIDDGEHPLEAVKRELKEETGYEVACDPELVGQYVIDPSGCDGHMYLYFCDNVKFTGGKVEDDPSEQIENMLLSVNTLREMLNSGEISAIGQIAAIRTILDMKGL